MTNQPSGLGAVGDSHRSMKKVWIVVLVFVLALIVWGVAQAVGTSRGGSTVTQGGTPSAQATAGASSSAAASQSATPSGVQTTPAILATAKPTKAGATASAPPVAPKPAPPASGPGLSKDAGLAAVAQPIATPVPLDKPATVKPGVGVTVTNIEAVDGVAEGIGEIAGPAIRFTVVIANNSGKDLSANSMAVSLEFGPDKSPAGQLSGPGTSAFPAVIANKQTASATFVFNVPLDQRQQVRILHSLNASSPIAAFEGAVSANKGKP